jgi:hypothetical protein
MPRLSGSTNTSDYKYKVEELNDNNEPICSQYFRTQKEIQTNYNLKRSAVYFHLHNKEMRKTKDNINIIKLTEIKPVYEVDIINTNDSIIKTYNRIVY